jgi:branched-chain amino acid transport system ATP-binding protein
VSAGAALSVTHVAVRYAAFEAVTDATLTVDAGSLLAVLGPNGAGKSTLCRAIAGLVPVSAGTVRLGDDDVSRWSPHRRRRAGLAYIPEGRGIFPALSVIDNLRMAARQLRGREPRRQAVERAVELFPRLGERRRQLAGSLSGGEQQMLGLARALVVEPRVLIADEMSLGLAPIVVDQVFAQVEMVRRTGVTVLLVEQFVHRALAIADRCVIMSRGRVAWSGTPHEAGNEVLDRYLGQESSEGTASPSANPSPISRAGPS